MRGGLVSAMEFLFEGLDASGHLLHQFALLLDDGLQRIDLLIELAFNINGTPLIVLGAHSVKRPCFYRVHEKPMATLCITL